MSGCAGQYSDCFSNGDDGSLEGTTILPSDDGGACVAFVMSGDEFIAKTMHRKWKFFLGCQTRGKIETTDEEFGTILNSEVILF